MANLGGPKGPGDPTKVAGARVLPFKPVKDRKEIKPVAEGKPSDVVFDPKATRETVIPEAGDGPKASGVLARLAAKGPLKTAGRDAVRFKETPVGRILDGSVTAESVEGLKKLEGVVRVTGDLVIQESALKSVDLVVLKSLVEIGGRLIVEGNAGVGALDNLESLERARGIYIGFNGALTRLALPKLKELEAALIVEGNPQLTHIELPAFTAGGLYMHVHDNAELTSLSMPKLERLGEELSLVANPKLTSVKVATSQKPARVGTVELGGNGTAPFPHLHAHHA